MVSIGKLEQTQLSFVQSGIEASKLVQSNTPFLKLSTNAGTNLATITASAADIITLSGAGGTVQVKGVTDPSAAQDAATKFYVDSLVVSGVTWKNTARLATDGNETGTFTYNGTSIITVTISNLIDGLTPVNGDRVLMKNQSIVVGTTPTQSNGIYVVSSVTGVVSCTLTRTADATSGGSANGAAIFIYAGDAIAPVNNDTTWVVTNDTAVTWGGATTVAFTLMSVAPAITIGGADTQVQFNNGGALGANSNFTFNKSTTAPTLSIGAAATSTTTLNMGNGASESVINIAGIGGLRVESADKINLTSAAGGIIITATGATASLIGGTGATVTATSGNVVIDTATNDWTFNGATLSSQGAFTTSAAVASNVSLFETTTSGTITLGNATAGTGTIKIDGSSSIINIGPTTTGAINVGSSVAGALVINSTSITIGTVANSTSTTVTGQNVNLGTATTTTTNVNGITATVGSTITTALNLRATGVSGNIVSTAGNGGTTGVGGAVTVNAGNGGSTSGIGGNVLLQGGSATAVGSAGNVVLKIAMAGTSTATNNLIEFQSNAGSQIARIENTGDMYATTFNATSDARYKTNINHLNDPLSVINKIESYSYNWKEDFAGYNDTLQYGVLAQQLEEVGLHNLVAGSEESKAVNYLGLIPLLIGAVKELSLKVDKYESIEKKNRNRSNW